VITEVLKEREQDPVKRGPERDIRVVVVVSKRAD
jgi:hypothetical protein